MRLTVDDPRMDGNAILWIVVILLVALPLHVIALGATIIKAIKGRSLRCAVEEVWGYEGLPNTSAATHCLFHSTECDCDRFIGTNPDMMPRYYSDLYCDPLELSPAERQSRIASLQDACADTDSCNDDGSTECCRRHRQLARLKALEA